MLILVLAAVNRSVLLARLGGDRPAVGRPAMRRLAGFVLVEAILALAIARHRRRDERHARRPVTSQHSGLHDPLSFAALEGRADEAARER